MKKGGPEATNPSVAFNALRLIAEMVATQDMMFHDLPALCESMDADEAQVWKIIDDAQRLWDASKAHAFSWVHSACPMPLPTFDIVSHEEVKLRDDRRGGDPALNVFLGRNNGYLRIQMLEDATVAIGLWDSCMETELQAELWESAAHGEGHISLYPNTEDGHPYGVESPDGEAIRFRNHAVAAAYASMFERRHEGGVVEFVDALPDEQRPYIMYCVDQSPYPWVVGGEEFRTFGGATEAMYALREVNGKKWTIYFSPEADLSGQCVEIDVTYRTHIDVVLLPGEGYRQFGAYVPVEDMDTIEYIEEVKQILDAQPPLSDEDKEAYSYWEAHAGIYPYTITIQQKD